ncbi:unnamed protein product [Arabidopsis arenosa]|uniref:RNase H type-1 domain-containing protein n=1 Tax=Arabidopsis arenosa TaxID=38785 RepID=A0A8S2ADZ7_ARAAE|nr:unnamed protein product [Arabidopsis arenosa]
MCWVAWDKLTKSKHDGGLGLRDLRNFNAALLESLSKAITDAKDWLSAQSKKLPPVSSSATAHSRMNGSTLSISGMSCRSDGAWRKDLQAAGLGWTSSVPPGITSHHSALCENVSSPLMAESLACRAAIMDAIDSGATHLLLESDCLQLVGAINAQSIILEIHGIISDIFLCVNSLSSFTCRFIPRSANVVADTLAKHCLSLYGQNI